MNLRAIAMGFIAAALVVGSPGCQDEERSPSSERNQAVEANPNIASRQSGARGQRKVTTTAAAEKGPAAPEPQPERPILNTQGMSQAEVMREAVKLARQFQADKD